MQIGMAMRKPSGITLAQRIRALFAAGEQGVWYDPADFSTLFQDSAGTTPVTAVGQPVGLVLDKSKGLVLGAELVVNGDFSSATGWTVVGGAITSGVLRFAAAASNSYADRVATTGIAAGKRYTITYTVVSISSGRVRTQVGGIAGIPRTLPGTYTQLFAAISNGNPAIVVEAAGTTADIDNISVRELPGNHASQATSTARPLRQASPTRIDYDAVDDTLVTTFASSLGAACTVCRAVPGVGASILTGQTIGTSYTDSTDHSGLIIVNRALTAAETASVTAYLNAKAFA